MQSSTLLLRTLNCADTQLPKVKDAMHIETSWYIYSIVLYRKYYCKGEFISLKLLATDHFN